MALSIRRNEISGTVTTLSVTPTHFAIAAAGGSLGVDATDAAFDVGAVQ